MSAQPNDYRTKGPGDLPGDPNHPNSPDYVEPEYGYEEADDDIAAGLEEAGEVSELVMDVRNAAALLNWIANNVELPVWALPDFRAIDRQASSISKRADELIEKYA